MLVLAAFVAGRYLPREQAGSVPPPLPCRRSRDNSSAARQRILLSSVADHLDRSARVLTDVMNTSESRDISTEQRWAEDLLTTSRLYRHDAEDAGEQSVASVLDDLERSLLEIVHSPSQISAADLEQIRRPHRRSGAALQGAGVERRPAAARERARGRRRTADINPENQLIAMTLYSFYSMTRSFLLTTIFAALVAASAAAQPTGSGPVGAGPVGPGPMGIGGIGPGPHMMRLGRSIQTQSRTGAGPRSLETMTGQTICMEAGRDAIEDGKVTTARSIGSTS